MIWIDDGIWERLAVGVLYIFLTGACGSDWEGVLALLRGKGGVVGAVLSAWAGTGKIRGLGKIRAWSGLVTGIDFLSNQPFWAIVIVFVKCLLTT
jgi:hypothetical protein